MEGPAGALEALAGTLRADGSVISAHVGDPGEERPVLGLLAATGPRASGNAAEYALVVESVREGYLLHYGNPRLVQGVDADLALLAGDYLYALGLDRLAALGDLATVRELSDLISLCAQLHAEQRNHAKELWLGSAVAVAAGAGFEHEEAKRALRAGDPAAPGKLWAAAGSAARSAGLGDSLARTAESIGFHPE